jgi:hypothetical protein
MLAGQASFVFCGGLELFFVFDFLRPFFGLFFRPLLFFVGFFFRFLGLVG